jgi:simple sugar transport system substrate-binding protein
MGRRFVGVALVVGLAMAVLSGCGSSSGSSGGSTTTIKNVASTGGGVLGGGLKPASAVHIDYVSCGPETNPFWSVVYRGASEAALNLGIHWNFLPGFGATPSLSQLNQVTMSAIAAHPDGIALCGLDPTGQMSTIQQAAQAGIPVVLTPPDGNSVLYNPNLPFIGQVGQDEPVGGVVAADQAVSRWHAKHIICTEDGTDTTQGARCKALVDEAHKLGAQASVQVVPDDQGQAANVLTSLLQRNQNVDTIVNTNSDVTLGAIQAKKAANRSSVHIVDFDLNTGVLDGIKDGTVDFAIDQQQYWRGYIPILLLTQYIRYGLKMADNFLSGPSIVDKSNVNQVMQLVAENIR